MIEIYSVLVRTGGMFVLSDYYEGEDEPFTRQVTGVPEGIAWIETHYDSESDVQIWTSTRNQYDYL